MFQAICFVTCTELTTNRSSAFLFQDMVKRRPKNNLGFSLMFAGFVGLIGFTVGFFLNHLLFSPPTTEWVDSSNHRRRECCLFHLYNFSCYVGWKVSMLPSFCILDLCQILPWSVCFLDLFYSIFMLLFGWNSENGFFVPFFFFFKFLHSSTHLFWKFQTDF